jgi:Ion channel
MNVLSHPHLRERALTALVVFEAVGLFVVVPLAAKNAVPIALEAVLTTALMAAVLVVVWGSRAAGVAMILAATVELLALFLRVTHPSERTEALDFAAALVFLVTLTAVVGIAVFGPGRVTVHRVLGAIAIYLNVAAAFALAYRVIDAFTVGAFAGKALGTGDHTIQALVYFSFMTLTTSGYGDIVPVDPLARSAASLEAVIGQLFPATLLARLITLELENRRV